MGSLRQSLNMKTSLILLACLLAVAVAQRGGGEGGRPGGGEGGRPSGPRGATCSDGSRPLCSDNSQPARRRGEPPCSDGGPPLTCPDGNPPVDRDGNPVTPPPCTREERFCCDGTVLQGRRPRCADRNKPVCFQTECPAA